MRCLMSIAFALLLLSGCMTAERGGKGAAMEKACERPAWFQGRFRTGTPAAEKLLAHWNGVFRKGVMDDNAFFEANKILDAALLESLDDKEACAILQHDHIVNDCMYALFKSHEALKDADDVNVMDSTLYGRRFAAMLKANEQRFSNWLPEFRKWDREHYDWSGAEWSALFEKRKPIGRLPEIWMGRKGDSDANLAAQKIEYWRNAENFPVRFGKDIEDYFKKGEKRLWLLQAIDKPEVPEGVKVYMNIHAFPGRCKVYVNASEAVSFEDAAQRSFSVPLAFDDGKQCVVVLELTESNPVAGDAVQHAPWPIWLVCDKR